MNLKKVFVFVISLFLTAFIGRAEEMSYAAKTFRTNIQRFLQEEGFAPSVVTDGYLCFKKEGTTYYINISGDKLFYIVFSREGLRTDGASEETILKAINDVNLNIRAIKCCFYEDCIICSIESYYNAADDFKYVFYSFLNILESSADLVAEAYSKYDSLSNSVGNSSSRTIPIDGPILRTSHHLWWATSIELNSHSTVVHKVVYPRVNESWVVSTKDEYIEDCDTGIRYYIQESSIGFEPYRTILEGTEKKSFVETYPALPSNVKRINIWSGTEYYVKDLQIR